jgi:hypothetical protein
MKKYSNNILILFMKSGKKYTYSLPAGRTRKEGLLTALRTDKLDPKNIQKAYYIPDAELGSTAFDDSFSIKGSIDLKLAKINERLPLIRKERDFLLQKLDVEFMKIIEEEDFCPRCKQHIVEIKKYLRDAPDLFTKFNFKDEKDIENFNILDNIFDIDIEEEGSGYTTPPEITIEEPNNHPSLPGFPLKGQAVVEDGKVKNIIVTQVGSSYLNAPNITISPPNEEGGKQAKAFASAPENSGQLSPIIMKAIKGWMEVTEKREENSNNNV